MRRSCWPTTNARTCTSTWCWGRCSCRCTCCAAESARATRSNAPPTATRRAGAAGGRSRCRAIERGGSRALSDERQHECGALIPFLTMPGVACAGRRKTRCAQRAVENRSGAPDPVPSRRNARETGSFFGSLSDRGKNESGLAAPWPSGRRRAAGDGSVHVLQVAQLALHAAEIGGEVGDLLVGQRLGLQAHQVGGRAAAA